MSQTESRRRSAQLIGELFDELVVGLADERGRTPAKSPYFALSPDPSAATYYMTPRRARLSPQDYELQGGTANGLLSALSTLWTEQGDVELLPLVPRLREIAEALSAEQAESDGTVDVLCYTLF